MYLRVVCTSNKKFGEYIWQPKKPPIHKRISRAENSAAEWKMKAIERREAAEALKGQLATAAENVKIQKEDFDESNKRCAQSRKTSK